MCVHIGSTQGGKKAAKQRFINNFLSLPEELRTMICIENDDRSYNVEEVLELCQVLKVPMILDYHHNRCLPSPRELKYYIDDIIKTWQDRTPKCHLSSGRDDIADRKHADFVTITDYQDCLETTKGKFDIMLEAKAKQQALFRLRRNFNEN